MFARCTTLVLCALLASGCSIHPLPENVTAVPTVQIVRQIRCEAQAALRAIVTDRLERIDSRYVQSIASSYRADPELTRGFKPSLFEAPDLADLKQVVGLFYQTAVAYNFDFDMTEDNNLVAGVDTVRPLTTSSLTAGFGLTANRKRENHRSFTVSDTFQSLLALPRWYCGGQQVGENFAYPIAGMIGIEPVLRDFIALTLFGGLGPKAPADDASKDKPGKIAKRGAAAGKAKAAPGAAAISGPPTLAEMLSFTTTVSASAAPKITFTPIGSAFQVGDASLGVTADRMDVHKVTLGIAIATQEVVNIDPLRTQFLAGVAGTLVVGRRVTGGGTLSQQLAVLAIDQFKRSRLDDIE